jgi:Tfp pilus assembly pilus retraction ATPase PilT
MPSAIQTGTQLGMQSLEQALKTLVMQSRVDRAHAEAILASTTTGSTSTTLGPPGPAPAGPAAARGAAHG